MPQQTDQVQKLPVEVIRADEPWAEVVLVDGTKIRVRVVITEVRRHVGEHTQDGKPTYSLSWQIVTHLTAPASLMKKP